MNLSRTLVFAGLLAVASLVVPAASQSQDVAGAIEGRVIDEAREPVAQAQITVTSASLQGRRIAFTDDRGRFRIPALPVGDYSLRVATLGYSPASVEHIVVSLGRAAGLGDIRIETRAIELAGTTVTASASLLDARSTAGGGSLAASAFRSLPVDRDYQSIVTLLPQANVSFFGDRANVSGVTGPESRYYVDGMCVSEPPGNAVSTSLPYNLVREVEVRESGYEAEFGGAGGGVVNAVTASGGNELHGQVFGFAANRLLTTNDGVSSLSPDVSSFNAYDAGVSVGGALRPDRLWYFLAYNPAFETQDIVAPGLGTYVDTKIAHRSSAKLAWQAGENTHVTAIAVADPSHRNQVGGVSLAFTESLGNPDPYLGDQDGGGVNLAVRVTRVLSARAYAEASLARSDTRYSLEPRTERGWSEPLYIDARTGYVEGGFGSITHRDAGRSTASGSFSCDRRDHSLKVGAAFEDESVRETASINTIRRLAASLFTYTTLPDRHSGNHVRVPTAYLSDSWLARDWLRLNLGLRWASEYWITSSGDVGQRISDEWQPRLGFVARPGGSGPARVFGSYGRFYQQTRLNVPQFFLQDTPTTFAVTAYDHDPRTDPSGGALVFAQILGRQPEVHGLRGAYFDEFQLGGERVMRGTLKVGLRGIYRRQREGIVGVFSPVTGQAAYGNPGRGDLSAYPRIDRKYRALELSLERTGTDGIPFRASYVLSDNQGNYEGYWDQSAGQNEPLGAGSFLATPDGAENAAGQLPNDRTHVVKLVASHGLPRGVGVGAMFLWASGTPLSELGSTPFGPPFYVHLSPRGSLGRTPSVYDLSVRLSYEPKGWTPARFRLRVLSDIYHIGNPRKPVFIDQVHYRGVTPSGVQVAPNPNYGMPLALQPPVAYRFGLELDW